MEVLRTSDKKRAPTGWAEVGARVKYLREQRGISRDSIASRTSVDATSLWRIERGEQWVSPRALQELSAELDVDVQEFFKLKNEPDSGSNLSTPNPMETPAPKESLTSILRAILSAIAGMNEHELGLVLRAIRGIVGGHSKLQDLDDRIKRG